MKDCNENEKYSSKNPSPCLDDFVHCYWKHCNTTEKPLSITISPDSFFKLIVEVNNNKISAYFLTGLWTTEIEITIPPNTILYGVKFKILAPEYIFNREIASLIGSQENLQLSFWDISNMDFDAGFDSFVEHIEMIIKNKLNKKRKIQPGKLQLSQLLYMVNGNISVEEVSNQISWSSRQISRYLNKYIGVSLKSYLNMQKCYFAYIQIREGNFFPEDGYYDQAHFIREVKKYTGHTPKELHEKQNDQFIQLKLIQKK